MRIKKQKQKMKYLRLQFRPSLDNMCMCSYTIRIIQATMRALEGELSSKLHSRINQIICIVHTRMNIRKAMNRIHKNHRSQKQHILEEVQDQNQKHTVKCIEHLVYRIQLITKMKQLQNMTFIYISRRRVQFITYMNSSSSIDFSFSQ